MNTNQGTAFITGASAGIGQAFARRLACDGYNLLLHGRSEPQLKSICQELHGRHGITTEYVIAELSHPDELRTLEERLRTIPDLTLLVNNAGFGTLHSFEHEDIGLLDAMIQTHITAPVRLMHAALPGMRHRRRGAIINVSSVAGFMVSPGSLYCATKAALTNLSESLDLQVRNDGVRVQALCPGFTRSQFHQRMGVDTSGDFFKHFMSAEEVVDQSLRALRRGNVVCIPGIRYKLAVLASRYLPRRVVYDLGYVYRWMRGQRNGV
jgi:short-subunit dehydrogenase